MLSRGLDVHASAGKEDASTPAFNMLTGHQTNKCFRASPARPDAIIANGEDVGCSKYVVNGLVRALTVLSITRIGVPEW